MEHQWDPSQYEAFEHERNQPFFDLLHLIHPWKHARILDLGCGSGTLTSIMHHRLHASFTLGIDASKEMLSKALLHQTSNLHFQEKDISSFQTDQPFQIIISNAALQWIPDHAALFKQITKWLAPEGQIAFQMPANQNFPTHTIALALSKEEPYRPLFADQEAPIHHLLPMEDYARLLESLGYESQTIRLQLYPHFLESTASVIEWVKGSLLTYYKSRLGPDLYAEFLKEYQKRLIDALGWSEPFFFPMKRLLLWAQLPAH